MNTNFKKKYLKYKSKYFNLKKNQIGGMYRENIDNIENIDDILEKKLEDFTKKINDIISDKLNEFNDKSKILQDSYINKKIYKNIIDPYIKKDLNNPNPYIKKDLNNPNIIKSKLIDPVPVQKPVPKQPQFVESNQRI